MKIKKFINKLTALFACLILFIPFMNGMKERAYADMPYSTYSYDYWKEPIREPQAFLYTGSFNGKDSGKAMGTPDDMFVTDEYIYIADTDNSRILILRTKDGSYASEISKCSCDEDILVKPRGVFVTEEGHIYVADFGTGSKDGRIVEFDETFNYLREFGRPQSELIGDSTFYQPTKVVVDKAGRIYVIAYGINMGLIEFNLNGEFQGFIGATDVSVNYMTYIWKNYFSTDEQKKRMMTIVPTEYSNIFLDEKNFIYATISNVDSEDLASGADVVRRLNPTGTDVLRRLGNYPISGDLIDKTENADFSKFNDICATDYGCYFVLNSAGGKVFAYDYDGNNLFAFGKKGNRVGCTKLPVAIGITSDAEKLFILDAQLKEVIVYSITDYARHLLSAMQKNNIGDAVGATAEWKKVLELNSNCELAYVGLGKAALKDGEYKKAMEYFELGNSRKYYSTAFYYYRKDKMQEMFPKFMLCLGIVIALILGFIGYKKFKRWAGEVRCYMEKH